MKWSEYRFETNPQVWKRVYRNNVSQEEGKDSWGGWHNVENSSSELCKKHINWKRWRKAQYAKDRVARRNFYRKINWAHIWWATPDRWYCGTSLMEKIDPSGKRFEKYKMVTLDEILKAEEKDNAHTDSGGRPGTSEMV